MWTSNLTFVVLGLLCMIIIGYFVLCLFRRSRDPTRPGPNGYPFLGIYSQLKPFNGLHKTLTSIGKRYGRTFQFKLLGKRVVVLRTVSIMHMAFENGHFDDRKQPFFQKYVLNNSGFAFADYKSYVPELQALFKKGMMYHIHVEKTRFEEVALRAVADFCAGMQSRESGACVNPDPAFKKLTLDLFSGVLIGESLPDDDPEMEALWEFIDSLYRLLPPSVDAPLRAFPWLRHLPIKHGRFFRSAIDARDRVTRRYFDSQKSTYKEGHVRGLVDICLRIQKEALATSGSSWLTDDYIKGLMLDTVVAGMSEMMKSIRMLILLMCHHQDVQSRVYTEICDVVGPCGTPSTNHREAMTYTQSVIMEMLRYVSQTPLAIPHKCNEDVVLDGYAIEKDAAILPNIWGIHHDEDVWGDPWDFRPERFLAEDGKTLLPTDHKFMKTLIPFSVGKRRCPGEDFAMSRLFLVLTSLLQRLHFRPPEGEELPSVDPRLYSREYPYPLPLYKCRVEIRMDCSTS